MAFRICARFGTSLCAAALPLLAACTSDPAQPGRSGDAGPSVDASAEGGQFDAGDTPCADRPLESCEDPSGDGPCLRAIANKYVASDGGWCRTDERVESCRERGTGCTGDEFPTKSCDDDGGVWQSPYACPPASHHDCGEAMSGKFRGSCSE